MLFRSTATVTPSKTPTTTPTPSASVTATPSSTPVPSQKCQGLEDATKKSYVCNFGPGTTDFGTRTTVDDPHRYVYCDSAGNIIKGYPNRNEGTDFAGHDASNYYPVRSGGDNWSIGWVSGVPVHPNLPAGTTFAGNGDQRELYIKYRGWLTVSGPFYVGGLYCHPTVCHDTVALNCVGIPHDPIAQTFYVDAAQNKNGVFISSVDLYFKNRGDMPIEVQIRPVDNGYPSSNTVVPGAVCTLDTFDVNTSDLPNTSNSSTRTRFTFSSPVYLNSGFDYAIVVITDDYGYDIYAAEKGKTVLGTTSLLSQQAFLGSLFKSENQRTWVPIADDDLMFSINKCVFSSNPGTVKFRENKVRQAKQTDEKIKYDSLELHSDAIELPGTRLDYYFKSMSNSSYAMDSSYTNFKADKRFDLEERKVILESGNTSYSYESRIDMSTTNQDTSPTVFQNRQNLVLIENLINNTGLTVDKFTITNPGDGTYSGNVEIDLSSNVGYGANVYGYVVDGNLSNIMIRSAGTGYVDAVYANVVSSDGYGNNATVAVATEVGQSGGPALCRYISKTVTLLDGYDAGDLRVYLTAVKPAGANVQVYYKVRNSLDNTPIENHDWVRMVQKTSEFIYSVNNEQIEYEYRPAIDSNNIIYSTDVATYRTFNQFAIKIVMASDGTLATNLPYAYDVRAIAMPGDVY